MTDHEHISDIDDRSIGVWLTQTPGGISGRHFVDLIDGMVASVELALKLTLIASDDKVAKNTRSLVPNAVRVQRAHYGSPIEIVVDLEPILKLITANGYVIFAALLAQILDASTSTIVNIKQLATSRRRRPA